MARSDNNLKAVLQDTADAIRTKKGTSEAICPRDFADEIGSIQSGGAQPTLFAPIITVSGNTVTWERDTRNGGFGDTLAANIDEEVVTQPLYITQELNNKKLEVRSIALNFEDGIKEQTLEYISVAPVDKKTVLNIESLRNYSDDTGNGYIQIAITNETNIADLILNKGKFVFNGTDYPIEQLPNHTSARACNLHVPVICQLGRQEIDLYLEIFEDIELPQDIGIIFRLSRYYQQTPLAVDYGTAGTSDTRNFRGNVYGFVDNEPKGTSNIYYCTISTENNVLKKGIYTAYFDMREV